MNLRIKSYQSNSIDIAAKWHKKRIYRILAINPFGRSSVIVTKRKPA